MDLAMAIMTATQSIISDALLVGPILLGVVGLIISMIAAIDLMS